MKIHPMGLNSVIVDVVAFAIAAVFVSFARSTDYIHFWEIEWDDVTRWYHDTDWLHPLRFAKKIWHVLRWVPLLWDDVDWDHGSLYRIIEKKLLYMEAHQRECDNYEGSKEVADQIKSAADSLSRALKDDYLSEEWDRFYAEHPTPPLSTWEHTPGGGVIMPPMADGARTWFNSLTEREEKLLTADLQNFAHLFVKFSRGWWD